MYEVLTVKLNLLKHMKPKPRTPAYVEEVYHRIEVEMCTARNAVVALDLRIGHIVAKLPTEDHPQGVVVLPYPCAGDFPSVGRSTARTSRTGWRDRREGHGRSEITDSS